MPKLQELNDKQLSYQIKNFKKRIQEGESSSDNQRKLKALLNEKKKRKAAEQELHVQEEYEESENAPRYNADNLGKSRNPWIVILLIFVTLGIYALIYIYKTAKELNQFREDGLSGILMVLMCLIPFAGILPLFLLPKYTKDMHDENNQPCSLEWYYGFIGFIPLIGLAWFVILQNRLNAFWESGANGEIATIH